MSKERAVKAGPPPPLPTVVEGQGSAEVMGQGHADPPSPGVDIHAVLGLSRPQRRSQRSEGDLGSESEDSEGGSDSDEEWQEGEYIVLDDDTDPDTQQVELLSENASLSRDMLLPIFTACIAAYEQWMSDQTASQGEASERRQQLQLYREVVQQYGSDTDWSNLTHAQRVDRNRKAYSLTLQAKALGPPPTSVSKVSVEVSSVVTGGPSSQQQDTSLRTGLARLTV